MARSSGKGHASHRKGNNRKERIQRYALEQGDQGDGYTIPAGAFLASIAEQVPTSDPDLWDQLEGDDN